MLVDALAGCDAREAGARAGARAGQAHVGGDLGRSEDHFVERPVASGVPAPPFAIGITSRLPKLRTSTSLGLALVLARRQGPP